MGALDDCALKGNVGDSSCGKGIKDQSAAGELVRQAYEQPKVAPAAIAPDSLARQAQEQAKGSATTAGDWHAELGQQVKNHALSGVGAAVRGLTVLDPTAAQLAAAQKQVWWPVDAREFRRLDEVNGRIGRVLWNQPDELLAPFEEARVSSALKGIGTGLAVGAADYLTDRYVFKDTSYNGNLMASDLAGGAVLAAIPMPGGYLARGAAMVAWHMASRYLFGESNGAEQLRAQFTAPSKTHR